MIKITTLEYYNPMWHITTFRQYTADNGKSIYTVGDRLVNKYEGNQEYIELIKSSKTHKTTTNVIDSDNKIIVENLYNSVDQYVEYIDDLKQYKSACSHNENIYAIIKAFEKVAEIF